VKVKELSCREIPADSRRVKNHEPKSNRNLSPTWLVLEEAFRGERGWEYGLPVEIVSPHLGLEDASRLQHYGKARWSIVAGALKPTVPFRHGGGDDACAINQYGAITCIEECELELDAASTNVWGDRCSGYPSLHSQVLKVEPRCSH
jgi:hypothetical protein